jgi:hypothetical protein
MTNVSVTRLADDPLCLRVSIGGGEGIGGYYCTYRGTREATIEALEKVLLALKYMPEQPIEEDPRDWYIT